MFHSAKAVQRYQFDSYSLYSILLNSGVIFKSAKKISSFFFEFIFSFIFLNHLPVTESFTG